MSAARPRRTQQERTANARELLSRAAFELIRDNGYANFRVAAVAKAAGVSQGGQLHHFPTKDAMTMAAIEYAIANATEKTRRNLAAYRPGQDLITAVIEDSTDYYFSDDFDVAMDITKSAWGNKSLKREIARAHRIYRGFAEGGWLDHLRAQGWPEQEARDLIAMTTSLVRGFSIRAMIQPDPENFRRLMARWHDMISTSFNGPQ